MGTYNICLIAGRSLKNNQRSVLLNLGKLLEDKQVNLSLVLGYGEDIGILSKYYKIYHSTIPRFDPFCIVSAFTGALKGAYDTKADIILNVSHPFPLGIAAVLCGRFKGLPVLLRMTGDPFTERELYDSLLVRLRKKMIHEFFFGKLFYSKATMILPVGKSLAKVLEEIGLPRRKIHVRPQPFDSRTFHPVEKAQKLNTKFKLGLDPDKKTILFVGSLSWGKGVDRLAKIIKHIEKKSEEYQFCILGKGPAAHYLESIKSERVILAGNVPREEVIKYFQAADLLVHPTRRDALPNVVLEAIASGIPVIASPVGEIPNYVTNIAYTDEEFVNMVLENRMVVDTLPAEMEWEQQKKGYLSLFEAAVNQGRLKHPENKD